MTNARVSQEVVEALETGTPDARVSQEVVEGLVTGTPDARVSQEVVEGLVTGTPRARVSQEVVEGLLTGTPRARASQIVVEALIVNLEVPVPLIYPDQSILRGLGYSVKWSPTFYNMPTETTASGADIDLGLAQYPLHDFELTYDHLHDYSERSIRESLEFKTLMGFWLNIGGTLGRFLFRNPDDLAVSAQAIGTTDGTTSVWTVVRTFGTGEYTGTEPIGWCDTTRPVNVYLNGAKQPADSYQILNTIPAQVQLKFNSTPSAGQAITMDFAHMYFCKFKDNSMTFEKFMDRLWLVQKVLIHSCRPGA